MSKRGECQILREATERSVHSSSPYSRASRAFQVVLMDEYQSSIRRHGCSLIWPRKAAMLRYWVESLPVATMPLEGIARWL